jgi:hypothetical protein
MMFPEGRGLYPGHPDLGGHIRFFNLDSGAFVLVRLPLFEDHCIIDSINGLLVLRRDEDTAVRLLNPFTGDIVDLPPLKTLDKVMGIPSCTRVCTSATFSPEGITVMLSFPLILAAVATPGDEQWTVVSWMAPMPNSHGPQQIQGKMYVASHEFTYGSDTLIHEMGAHLLDGPKLIAICPTEKLRSPIYLVECDSEIIAVGYTDPCSSCSLMAYKLADIAMGVFTPLTSIGDKAIFLGIGRALCVSSKALPTVVGDTIVCDRLSNTHGFGQYHLRSGTWSQPFDKCNLNVIPHGPCSLIRHVLTCCFRMYWYVCAFASTTAIFQVFSSVKNLFFSLPLGIRG